MYNIGRRKLVLFLCGIMFLCFGLGTLITFAANGWNFDFGKNTIVADDTKVSDIIDVKEISIDISSSDINIIPEDRSDIKAVLSGSIISSSEVMKPELTLSKSSGRIIISMKSQNTYWGLTSISLKVDVFIPKNYADNLLLNTSSGDINMNYKMNLSAVKLSLSSGDVVIKDLSCNEFGYDSSSGSFNADTLNTKATKLHSSSGDIIIKNFTGNVEGESSSGDISITYSTFSNNVNLHASSGEINLKLPESAEFYVEAECSSGDLECDFPVTTIGKQKEDSIKGTVKSGSNKVKLDTSSGDINIRK